MPTGREDRRSGRRQSDEGAGGNRGQRPPGRGGKFRSNTGRDPGPGRHGDDEEEYLSPNMAGRELGVTGEAVKQWIYRHNLRATKLPNGYWRIARSDLDRYLSERREGARRRVLLVGSGALALARGVEEAGWRALVAANPIDAVLRAAGKKPSAVAIDVASLGEAGWRAAERLRSTRGTRKIPILLLAPEGGGARRGEDDVGAMDRAMDRAIAIGAQGYLCGPLTGEDLVGAVAKLYD